MKFKAFVPLFSAALLALSLSAGALAAQAAPRVMLETSMGNITLELDADKAPVSVANFVQYVKSGQYNGTIFHRVISSFMIQGGGLDQSMQEKSTLPPIANEADNGLKNVRGSLAMARTNDPQSASAQFFINVVDNGFLDFQDKSEQGWGYAVFGKVVDGMDVVDKIKATPTDDGNVPLTPVIIQKAELLESAK